MYEQAVVRRIEGGLHVSIERLTGPSETYGPLERLESAGPLEATVDGDAVLVIADLAVGDRVAVMRSAWDPDAWVVLGRLTP